MKKMISLACALMMMLGVSAQTILPRHAAMATQSTEVLVDSVLAFRASQLGEDRSYYYDWQFFFYKNGQQVASLEVLTKEADKLAGLYAIEPSANSTIGSTKVYGVLAVTCTAPVGVTYAQYMYEGYLYQGNTEYHLTGQGGMLAADYEKVKANDPNSVIQQKDVAGAIPGSWIDVNTFYNGEANEDYLVEHGIWGYSGYDEENYVDLVMDGLSYNGTYYIGPAPYYVKSGAVTNVVWNGNQPSIGTNERAVVSGVVEVGEDYSFNAYLQCADGNLYAVSDADPSASGVEEVEAAETEGTAKVMKDGQLIIIRNGVRYNAQGALVD